jgi:hypothetical protein
MNYLEVGWIDNVDLEALVRLILPQHNKDISDCFSLNVRFSEMNDELTQKWQNIINTENLHNNCLLSRAFNNIYFQFVLLR